MHIKSVSFRYRVMTQLVGGATAVSATSLMKDDEFRFSTPPQPAGVWKTRPDLTHSFFAAWH